MVSAHGDEKAANEIEEELEPSPYNYVAKYHQTHIDSNTPQRGLLHEKKHGKRFVDTVKGLPRFKQPGSSSKFWRIADERTESSLSASSPHDRASSSISFRIPFVRKVEWPSLWKSSKRWIRDPFNMALFAWTACVAVSGAILFLVMTGMLKAAMPRKSQRDTWFEVNNQILNALFTLMCLYQHPKRLYHLVLLFRWRQEDAQSLREVYCKGGAPKPNEWKHMMVVVVLLHVNCFAQYALCGLNLGYSRSTRPAIGVGLCVSVAISAPAFASVYNILSPLGREYEIESDHEAQDQAYPPEKRYTFVSSMDDQRIHVSSPEWQGGLFDFWDDISLAYISLFCSCCVFGWNMDRLGFGNMYVHITTFFLFCLAPFFIFNLAAININNEDVREALGIAGFLLCIFGLLYGGFWRIQMRRRFNLPGNGLCCGKPAVTDCFQWLCCCACSLAQEVRTADCYEVVNEKLYVKETSHGVRSVLSPLRREEGSSYPDWVDSDTALSCMQNSPFGGRLDGYAPGVQYPLGEEGSSRGGTSEEMKPPATKVIQREDLLQ